MAKIYGVRVDKDNARADYSVDMSENDEEVLGQDIELDDMEEELPSEGYETDLAGVLENGPYTTTTREPASGASYVEADEELKKPYTPKKGKLNESFNIGFSPEEMSARDKGFGGTGEDFLPDSKAEEIDQRPNQPTEEQLPEEQEEKPPPKKTLSEFQKQERDIKLINLQAKKLTDESKEREQQEKIRLAEELNKINTAEIKYDALKRKRFEKAEKLRFEYIQKELAKLDKEQNRVYIEGGGKIDPERYLGSGLTWRRVGAFVSLLLAGIGGPAYLRVAHENIKGAIDRDIASQKAALAMKKEKWKTRRNLLGDMLKLTGSMSLAEKASRIQMAKEVDNLIEARKATTNIQSEKEKLTQLQIENRKSMEVDKKKLIPAHEIPMGVFVPKHHVKTKLQRETYVPIGNLGGQFAPDSSAAQKAREVVNKYNPAIQKSKKLIDFFKNPEYAGLFGKQTMIPKGMGKKANILEALHKDLLNEMRTLQGAGAAFTQAEIGLILGVIGKDFNSFTGLPLDERFHLVVGMLSEGLSYRLNSYGVDLAPEALFNYDRSAYKRAKAKILGQRE